MTINDTTIKEQMSQRLARLNDLIKLNEDRLRKAIKRGCSEQHREVLEANIDDLNDEFIATTNFLARL